MNDELNRHLDGEIDLDALGDEARREAAAWERMVEAFRVDAPRGVAPPWLENRVMAQIEAMPVRTGLGRLVDWLLNPRPVRVSPLAAALVTAAFAAVILLPGRETPGPLPTGAAPGTAQFTGMNGQIVYVQFVLEAPGATSVSVAGDFTDWEARYPLEDADQDGVWTGRVPVRPGVHAYMFLVDGSQWQTDPRAERYQDDGFGNRNAVLAVASGD